MTTASNDWLGLAGKLCVITGAAGGIGRATAVSFAQAGVQVVLLDRNEQELEETARAVSQVQNGRALAFPCDISDSAAVTAVAEKSKAAAGPCDILVNNAGLLRPGALETLSLAEWNGLLAVNLSGYLLCAQAFGVQMRGKGGGAIVHVASIAGSQPQAQSGAYSASKTGVIMLSRQIAVEWGPAGIRSNVVSPGLVETPMSQAFYATPGVRERRSALVPMRRIAQPQDIADAILFLASRRASYVSGDEIVVDGGYTQMLMSMMPRPGYE
ncbi:MAG: SDR family oxidoreductase [Bradyrhizobium sp.]|uniref:SDR family NAD(P)-dependent oxidoreductase n=1 Tax=Bradyrhizobium sp. TaxID=376 RepID=UPI001DFD5311|nr:SDR family oxidoreductase [Bradyrhizobium sp.]MBV9565136.1 SDR family oxidoreductase [Bradyrhizobium sp.]